MLTEVNQLVTRNKLNIESCFESLPSPIQTCQIAFFFDPNASQQAYDKE